MRQVVETGLGISRTDEVEVERKGRSSDNEKKGRYIINKTQKSI